MFWRFTLPSKVDSILEKENVSLLELLEEDDILQECKGQNQKLIDFLTQKESMDKLIDLIVVKPNNELDERHSYKFPNTACELITSDVNQITNVLADDVYFERLYTFLNTSDSLNPLLASFVSRVFCLLIMRKAESILSFVKSKNNFMDLLLKHLETSAICELLTQFISCSSTFSASNSFPDVAEDCVKQCRSWLLELNLIERLVNLIHPKFSCYIHANASGVLMEIIRLHREFLSAKLKGEELNDEDDLIAKQAESSDCINTLIKNMLSWRQNVPVEGASNPIEEEQRNSVLVHGFSILHTLIDPKACAPTTLGPLSGDPIVNSISIGEMTSNGDVRVDESLNFNVAEAVITVVEHFADIHQLLLTPPNQHYSIMKTTVGVLKPPVGQIRLAVIRMLATILERSPNEKIYEKLVEFKTFQVLLDLFFQYSWNNMLHTQVEKCISSVLFTASENVIEGSNTYNLVEQLFSYKHCSLLSRILWAFDIDRQNDKNTRRAGYMGHLTKIANQIVNVSKAFGACYKNTQALNDEDSMAVETPRTGMPDTLPNSINNEIQCQPIKSFWNEWIEISTKDAWTTFTSSTLESLNNKNIITPVRHGNIGMPSSSEDGDDDFKQISFQSDSGMQANGLESLENNLKKVVNFSSGIDDMIQAFSDYQLQQMTSNFVDNFGFEPNDFAETGQKPEAIFSENANKIDFDSVEECAPQSSKTLFDKLVNSRINMMDDQVDDSVKIDDWNSMEVMTSNATTHSYNAQNKRNYCSDDDDDNERTNYKHQSSSDSSDDLDSPAIIRPTIEKMDIEKEKLPMNTNDMDTSNSKDDSPEMSKTKNWASFDNLETVSSNDNKVDGWANFTNTSPSDRSKSYVVGNGNSKTEENISNEQRLVLEDLDTDEHVLSENFDFLSNSGLMKTEEIQDQLSTAEESENRIVGGTSACNGSPKT